MKSNFLISIIIPCFNDAEFVEQAVDSALNQSYDNIEVIVIDDGSNKETKVILKKLEPKIAKLITQENSGQSTARNNGIKIAKGEYIFLLDSDDYLESTICSKIVKLFDNTDIKIATCQAKLVFDDLKFAFYTPKGGTVLDFLNSNAALGTSMFKKSDWIKVGGFDQNMRNGCEDWEFFIRILKDGGSAKVIQEPLYNYRKRNGSTTSTANKNKYLILKYIYIKHKDLYKDNFEKVITHLLDTADKNRENEFKRMNSIDFRLGKLILQPFRFVKSLLK